MRLRDSGLSSRTVGGEVVVLDIESSRYLTISGVLATFEVDEDTACRDVDAFIADLSDAGLLAH